MKKKALLVLAISSLFATALTALPASAATAIRSGQNCSKADAVRNVKFKGDTYVYKCVKNPRYKATRLTWTLEECLTAIKDFADAQARITALGAAATSTDTELLGLARQLRNMSCKAGI